MGDWLRHRYRPRARKLVGALVVAVLLMTLAILTRR